MEEAFYNLFLNACVKQMPEGGTITVAGGYRRLQWKSYAVSVTDTGKGIPENRIPQIFTPFTRHKGGASITAWVRLLREHFTGNITENNCEKHAVFRNYFHTVVPSQPYP